MGKDKVHVSTVRCPHSQELLVPEQCQLGYFQRGADGKKFFLPLSPGLEAKMAVYLGESGSQDLKKEQTSRGAKGEPKV